MKFTMLPAVSYWSDTGADVDPMFLALPMPGEVVSYLPTYAINGTMFPLVITMEQLCKWWHRVRTWQITANHPLFGTGLTATLSLDESDTTDEEIVLDMPNGWPNVGTADPFDWFRAGRWTGSFTYVPDGFTRTVSFTLTILPKTSATILRSYYVLANEFSSIVPFVRLQIEIDGIDGNQARGDTAGFFDETPPTAAGTMTCDIDGQEPIVSAACATGSGFESDPVTFVCTPSLYWAYANADSTEPTYDTLTGAQL